MLKSNLDQCVVHPEATKALLITLQAFDPPPHQKIFIKNNAQLDYSLNTGVVLRLMAMMEENSLICIWGKYDYPKYAKSRRMMWA